MGPLLSTRGSRGSRAGFAWLRRAVASPMVLLVPALPSFLLPHLAPLSGMEVWAHPPWGPCQRYHGHARGAGSVAAAQRSVGKHCSQPPSGIISHRDFCLNDQVCRGTQLIRPGVLTSPRALAE